MGNFGLDEMVFLDRVVKFVINVIYFDNCWYWCGDFFGIVYFWGCLGCCEVEGKGRW